MNFKLFEFFNTTNQTSPHFERHMNFAKPEVPYNCDRISLLDRDKRCEFVTKNENCQNLMFLFHYLKLFYCKCEDTLSQSMCLVLLIAFCGYLFWMVYVITEQYLVPALTEVLKALNLTENLAGITVMAIGGCASDVLLLTMGSSAVFRHLYSDCVASCIFLSVFTSSAVMWVTPFSIDGTIFLRDIGFVLLLVCYIDFSIKLNNGVFDSFTVISITSIFIIYIVVVAIDEYLQILRQKKRKMTYLENDAFPFAVMTSLWDIELSRTFHSPNDGLFKHFFKVFDLLDKQMFRNKWTFLKLWALVKMPPMIIFHLLIPHMNLTDCPSRFSKLLCCIQIPLTPSFMVLVFIYKYFNFKEALKWSLPVALIVPVCCLPISCWAFRNSRTDMVPKWYKYITILSVSGSIMMINFVGAELISLLRTLGIISNLSDTFISCTFYTWGTQAADFITIVTMARKGYPRMAYAACFGLTIFTIFFILCFPIIYSVLQSGTGTIDFTEGTIGDTFSTMMTISLFTILIYGCTTNFMLRRTGATIGITLYLYSLVQAISSEFEFIHAFGTDHRLDRGHFNDNYGD